MIGLASILAVAVTAQVFPDNARIAPHVSAARTQRIAVVGLGDSNELFGGAGWDEGWTVALRNRYGTWGTGLLSPGEGQGVGVGAGYGCWAQTTAASGAFQYSGAPRSLEPYLDSYAAILPQNYLYLPEGFTARGNILSGLAVGGAAGLDLTGALRFSFAYGVFPSPASFTVAALTSSGVAATQIVPCSGPWGPAVGSMDLPPGDRQQFMRFTFADPSDQYTGPMLIYWMQLERLGLKTGAAFHTLYGGGGKSARDMAAALTIAPIQQLTLYFNMVRGPLGSAPKVIVRINSGVNDRSEWEPSVGHGYLPGDSAPAFSDNVATIIDRVRAVWTANDWNLDELRFVIAVSHPIAAADDPHLIAYRAAARALARTDLRVVAVDLSLLAGYPEILANDWYDDHGNDPYHLLGPGVQEIAARELRALSRPACAEPADLDDSGEVNTHDMLALLERFGTSVTYGQGADIVPSGVIDTADLLAVLSKFGQQTCNAEY